MEKSRCFGEGKPFYAHYHDVEWGVKSQDDRHLFEMLSLEGAQAGLSWELILQKREGYRAHFHSFDPNRVASMSDEELEEVLQSSDVIRNRRKIFSVRQNAIAFLKIQKEFGSFFNYLWQFIDHKPIVNHWKTLHEVPCVSDKSIEISKDLKKRSMSFVGPKIIYSFMQAVGMIDDHLLSCFKRL